MTRSDLAQFDRFYLSQRLFDLPGLLSVVGCLTDGFIFVYRKNSTKQV